MINSATGQRSQPRNRTTRDYRGCNILVEEANGFYHYSVLNPHGIQFIGKFREADSCRLEELVSFLEKQCDEYLLNPNQYNEDAEDLEVTR